MKEIWKDIKGYEGLYQISNLGNVRSLHWNHSNRVRLLTPYINGGYKRVGFRVNNVLKNHLVHVLIANAFIPNPQGKPCINHIDGNKLNNDISNLEWVTHKENTKHAIDNNLRPLICKCVRKKRGENPVSKKVVQKSLDGETIKIWDCSLDIADELGFQVPSIRRCCRGERKTYMGFRWEYL